MTCASSCGSSENCRFACRSALLIGESSDSLHRQVIEALAARLRSRIDLVVARPGVPNGGLPPGARVPDLIIRLDLLDIDRKGLMPWRQFDVTYRVSMGQSLHAFRQYYSAADSAPLAQLTWSGTLKHHSTLIGLGTGPIVTDMAKALDEAIGAEIESKRSQFGELPELPSSFYGPYHPTPPFWFPEQTRARQILSGYGLLRHNMTFWNIEPPESVADFFKATRDHYVGEGWRNDGGAFTPAVPYLRLVKGKQTLEVFGIFDGMLDSRPSHYGARYEEGLSAEESEKAMAQLRGAPLESQIVFAGSASQGQRDELLARIRESQCTSAPVWFYLSRNQKGAEALRSLRRAKVLVHLQENNSLASRIDEEVRKLSTPLELTVQDYLEAGYEALADGPVEMERGPDQPLLLLDARPDHPARAIGVLFRPVEKKERKAELRVVQSWDNARAWSSSKQESPTGSPLVANFGEEDRRYRVEVTPKDDGGARFLIKPER